MRPDVAVVIIGYNDADRLPKAIGSVLAQTLDNVEIVVVDDASTDGMGRVADEWATRSPKVRAFHLPANSGGCGRPRNVGLRHVRARYVMFLDSDDVLERHACKNMLLTAERTGAELVAGRCVRRAMHLRGRRSGWFDRLYSEPRVLDGIAELPELLRDTLCTNKLYDVEFLTRHGIRFPEEYLYEDLAFITEAYCSARRIAIVPEVVYYWHSYDTPLRRSITSDRANPRNFRDRLAVHRLIRDFVRREGHAEIGDLITDRLLQTELRLYLLELADRDDSYRREWMRVAGKYLRELDVRHVLRQERACRLAAYLVRRGNLELALKAAELWRSGRIDVPLVLRGDRVYFADEYLDDPAGRQAMDVTWLRLRDAGLRELRLHTEISGIDHARGRFRLRGAVPNQLGRLPATGTAAVSLELRSRTPRGAFVVRRPVEQWSVDADRLTFEAAFAADELPRGWARVRRWTAKLRIEHETGRADAPLVLPTPARAPEIGDAALTPELGRAGALEFRDNRRPQKPLRLRVRHQVGRIPGARPLRDALIGRPFKGWAYRHVLRRLPLRRTTVVFESNLGKQYSDNPRAVYEHMVAQGLDFRAVWSYAARPQRFPDSAVLVRRDSWRYYYELARAGYVVDNQGLPAIALRRAGQRYLQTWHGSNFKHMGTDIREVGNSPARAAALHEGAARWDDFVVVSEFAARTLAPALGVQGRVLRTGYPRNDRLYRADPEEIEDLRRRLELPAGRRIVLYAPTFRRYPKPYVRADPAYRPRLDIDRFDREVGDDWFLLVRAHYLDRVTVAGRHRAVARNVSGHDDVADLLLVADALITDYSSIMFDFPLTGRPIGFFAPDLELYRHLRGSYFDLRAEAPGPVLDDMDGVVAWLQDIDDVHARYAQRYAAFRATYASYDTGRAAEQVVRAVFRPFFDERRRSTVTRLPGPAEAPAPPAEHRSAAG